MDNRDLLNAGIGYVAGNSIMNSAIRNLRKERERIAERLAHITDEKTLGMETAKYILSEDRDGAYEYLNSHFNEEIADACLNQKEFGNSLETIIRKRKEKYMPFYEKIGRKMPENLSAMTADKLCSMLGVENLHIEDPPEKQASAQGSSDSKNGMAGCAALVVCLIVAAIVILLLIKYS